MKHELWKEENGYTFCLAGSIGDGTRAMIDSKAKLIWTVEANCHFEAMTKYYEFMNWDEYKTEFEEDKKPYSDEWVRTQK